METIININGKDVKITLTPEQVAQIKKSGKITDRIKNINDVYYELGINKSDFEKSFMFVEDLYAAKIRLITKVLNEGWEPNWNDSNEYKYFPWYEIKGSGFFYSYYDGWYSSAYGGSRFAFKSRELCEYAQKTFNTEFENQFIIKK